MPENFSYTPDMPDKKLYSQGVFEPKTYDSAYEFRKNPPKNIPNINPQRDELAALRKRESATISADKVAAAKSLQGLDGGPSTAPSNNIVQVNENYGGIKLQGDWDKTKDEFTGIYDLGPGGRFQGRGKMRPSYPVPIPIEGRLTQRDGTILFGKFHPPASKTLKSGTIIYPDGSSVTREFGPDGVPTKIIAQKSGKGSPNTVVEKRNPDTVVAGGESPNSILVNIGLLDPNTRINPKSMNPKGSINPNGLIQPGGAPHIIAQR